MALRQTGVSWDRCSGQAVSNSKCIQMVSILFLKLSAERGITFRMRYLLSSLNSRFKKGFEIALPGIYRYLNYVTRESSWSWYMLNAQNINKCEMQYIVFLVLSNWESIKSKTRAVVRLLVPRIIWEVRFILPSSLFDLSSAICIIYIQNYFLTVQ